MDGHSGVQKWMVQRAKRTVFWVLIERRKAWRFSEMNVGGLLSATQSIIFFIKLSSFGHNSPKKIVHFGSRSFIFDQKSFNVAWDRSVLGPPSFRTVYFHPFGFLVSFYFSWKSEADMKFWRSFEVRESDVFSVKKVISTRVRWR